SLGVMGYFAYQNYQLRKLYRISEETVPDQVTPMPTLSPDEAGNKIINVDLMVRADETATEATPISITTGRPTSPSIINQKEGDYSIKVSSGDSRSQMGTVLWSCSFPVDFDYTGPVLLGEDYSEVEYEQVNVSYRIPYEPEMKSVQLWHKDKLIFFKKLSQISGNIEDNTSVNLLTQDNEFINTVFGYRILYSDLFEIVTPNPEASSAVNFRKKDDATPAESGISINVVESTSSLSDVCGTNFLENQGILCNKEKFKFNPLLDAIPWEIYGENNIGYIPTGYVYASTFKDGKIYYIVNYGYEEAEAYALMINFEFIK
ncbi:hypothetical protein ACFL0Y_04660, partial [Patescibacteria group bacterium]